MRLMAPICAIVLAVAIGRAERPQEFEVAPALKEADGLAYVDVNTRLGYLQRAQLWQPMDLDQIDARAGHQIVDSHGRSIVLPNDAIVECNYVHDILGGTTNKFHCDLLRATEATGKPLEIRAKSDGLRVHPLDLQKWSEAPVWKDSTSCIAKLHMNMGNGAGLSDPEIFEAGRQFLANLLANLIQHESTLRDIFEAARIQEYDDHGHTYSADDWVKVFQARAAQIIDHPPCPR
jgi:hypothetical protein